MCNCGRKAPEVITSAQATEDMQRRAEEDYAANEAQRIQSAQNALSNANSGWFIVEEVTQNA